MRLGQRARVSAALTQYSLIRCRCKLRLDLSKLLPDEIHHKTRAWREMPSRWIDQAVWKAWRPKVAQDANQPALGEVIEHLDQRPIRDSESATRGQVHRTHVVGKKSAGHLEGLGPL